MAPTDPGQLLRVYLSENDRWEHHALYEALVKEARRLGLAGATVLRGPLGFGHKSTLHSARILRLSDDLPVVIEVVDQAVKIDSFLPRLRQMAPHALVTLEDLQVLRPSEERQDT